MITVKTVHLQNYCGYSDCTFDFSDKPFSVFYGPNGIGKSTCLDAIRMAGNAAMFRRTPIEDGPNLLLRKSILDEDYIPTVDSMKKAVKNPMLIEVVFKTDDGDKKVVIDNQGTLLNELPPTAMRGGYVYFADADNPMNTSKFLLSAEHASKFLEMARITYGYECDLGGFVAEQGVKMFTDFVIKKGTIKVHFKRMSAGEKKIATLISDLLQPINTQGRDIILIDNVEMHVYFKRHARMIAKLMSSNSNKQLITTTHSHKVIEFVPTQYHFDLEAYRPDYKVMEFDEEDQSAKVQAASVVQGYSHFTK